MMTTRIEVYTTVPDPRADIRQKSFSDFPSYSKIRYISITDVYTIDKELPPQTLQEVGERISNPVTQSFSIHNEKQLSIMTKTFDWAIEIGFLPGVTDNVGHTVKEIIEDVCN